MKSLLSLLIYTLAMGAMLLAPGCSSKHGGLDTGRAEASFQSAAPDQKAELDQVIASLSARDYPAAAATLGRLAGNARLTPVQREAVADLIEQVNTMITNAPTASPGQPAAAR